MRATRDLLRRRCHVMQKRAELLAHIQNTASQYTLAPLSKKIAYKANRAAGAEHFPDPAVRQSIEMNLALIDHYDGLLTEVELAITRTAKGHNPHAFHRLRTVPGIGTILALVILYDVQEIGRFPSVGRFASSSRLVKCEQSSDGKRYGYGGKKIGNAHRKWAFSEAATLCLRKNPLGQAYFSRLAQKHGKPKALSILAHKLGRAVYFRLEREQAFDLKKFVGAPD